MTLTGKIIIKGKIKVLTGLHIGGSKSSLDIGGIDNAVIKTVQGVPYIPGSSLKGKLRSLLAKEAGSMSIEADKDDKNKYIPEIFGYSGDDKVENQTRLLVRDAMLYIPKGDELKTDELKKLIKFFEEEGYTEEKTENVINRLTGTAKDPRQIERVPAGSLFEFELVYNVFDDKKKEEHLNYIRTAMSLLQDDYIGGSGSRGYGKIEFVEVGYKENVLKDGRYEQAKGLTMNFLTTEFKKDETDKA
jgi:CRISPR-associated protein Csm3